MTGMKDLKHLPVQILCGLAVLCDSCNTDHSRNRFSQVAPLATLNICCIHSFPWMRAPVHSVSSSTQPQLSTYWSHISSQRQKLCHKNVV